MTEELCIIISREIGERFPIGEGYFVNGKGPEISFEEEAIDIICGTCVCVCVCYY